MLIQDRTYSPDTSSYRFGFNGYEKDDNMSKGGNVIDFGARVYDCRVARFMSIDPWAFAYSWQGVYSYYRNSPIVQKDFFGKGDNKPNANNPGYSDNETGETTYIVEKGDCVWNIAKYRLGEGATNAQIASLQNAIIKANNLNKTGDIEVNQMLVIPAVDSKQTGSRTESSASQSPQTDQAEEWVTSTTFTVYAQTSVRAHRKSEQGQVTIPIKGQKYHFTIGAEGEKESSFEVITAEKSYITVKDKNNDVELRFYINADEGLDNSGAMRVLVKVKEVKGIKVQADLTAARNGKVGLGVRAAKSEGNEYGSVEMSVGFRVVVDLIEIFNDNFLYDAAFGDFDYYENMLEEAKREAQNR